MSEELKNTENEKPIEQQTVECKDESKLISFHSLLKKFKEDVEKIPNYDTTMNKYVIPLFEILMDECRSNTHHLIIISDLEKRVKCLENETDK